MIMTPEKNILAVEMMTYNRIRLFNNIVSDLNNNKTLYSTLIAVLIVFIPAFLFIKDIGLVADEYFHFNQIAKFLCNDFTLIPELTMFPGYHVLVAAVSSLFYITDLSIMRLISLLLSSTSIVFFVLLLKSINCSNPEIKLLQFSFLPILFPLFFLFYTDVVSMSFVLLTLYLTFHKKYYLAGIFGLLSMAVRQNNIIWIIFMLINIYCQQNNSKFIIGKISGFIKDSITFILSIIIFVIFIIVNNGIAIGDRAMHPSFNISGGNIFFMLFIFFFLFLPMNLLNLAKIIALLKVNKKYLLLIVILFPLYFISFNKLHTYNNDFHFLRNVLLDYFKADIFRVLFYFPIVYSILSISVTVLKAKRYYSIYPLTLISLFPSSLIEQRYYIIPLSLFILFKESYNNLVEYVTVLWFIAVSLVLLYIIERRMFFI